MKTRPDLNELSKQVFENNKKRGFHEVEHSNEHLLMLVITELSEAVEADRKGRRASLQLQEHNLTIQQFEFDKVLFVRLVKDTIEDELADSVIRLLDLAGCRDDEILETDSQSVYKYEYQKMTFTECIYDIVYSYGRVRKELLPTIMIKRIEILCEVLNIDLWLHVELKLKYNETREYKHNKRY